MRRLILGLTLIIFCAAAAAAPAETATMSPRRLRRKAGAQAAAKPAKKTPPKPKSPIARESCSAPRPTPAPLAARSIGAYAKGCLAGGVSLPINGPDWQVMRLSRNRNWGNPRLIDYLERLASDARAFDGWPGSSSATCRSRAADRCSPAIPATRSGSMPIFGSPPCRTAF